VLDFSVVIMNDNETDLGIRYNGYLHLSAAQGTGKERGLVQ